MNIDDKKREILSNFADEWHFNCMGKYTKTPKELLDQALTQLNELDLKPPKPPKEVKEAVRVLKNNSTNVNIEENYKGHYFDFCGALQTIIDYVERNKV